MYGYLKKALLNMRRNIWLTITSVLVMTLTFFMTSVFSFITYGSTVVLDFLESKAQVTVFFKDEATEEDILHLKQVLESQESVAEVNYISKEEALNIYMSQHQNEPTLLESITANIFPASLDIKTKKIAGLEPLVAVLKGEAPPSEGTPLVLGDSTFIVGIREKIEEIVFYQDVLETFKKWSYAIRVGGISFVSVMLLVSVLITLVTVGMIIRSQREEVEIMKLVGATDWYIRWPYLIQGVFCGVVAAFISTAILFAAAPLILSSLGPLLRGIPLPRLNIFLLAATVFAAEAVLGALLGVIGSLVAVRKYLSD